MHKFRQTSMNANLYMHIVFDSCLTPYKMIQKCNIILILKILDGLILIDFIRFIFLWPLVAKKRSIQELLNQN